jgi:hypothetical protein
MTHREQFEQQGYLIVRNIFTPDEVAQLRQSAYEYRDRQQKLGLVSQVKQEGFTGTTLIGISLAREPIGKDRIPLFGSAFTYRTTIPTVEASGSKPGAMRLLMGPMSSPTRGRVILWSGTCVLSTVVMPVV